jgi:Leucine-rich repeat (LRR) protein
MKQNRIAAILAVALLAAGASSFAQQMPVPKGPVVKYPDKPIGRIRFVGLGTFEGYDAGPARGLVSGPSSAVMSFKPDAFRAETPGFFDTVPANIEGLDLSGAELGNEQVAKLANRFKNLRYLNVTDTDVTDALFARLPEFPKLETLEANSINIQGSGLEHLKKMPNLKYVCLKSVPVRPQYWKHLADVKNLLVLRVPSNAFDDAACVEIAKLPKLKTLDISSTSISNKGMDALAPLSDTITSLDVSLCEISDEGLTVVKQFAKLEAIFLRTGRLRPFTAKGFSNFAGAKKLIHLDFAMSSVKDDVMAVLPTATPNINVLYMPGCKQITDAAFSHVSKLQKVNNFFARDTQFGDQGMEAISSLPNLMTVQVGNTRVGDAGLLKYCDKKCPVDRLVIDNTKVTDKGLVNLYKLPNLRSLSLTADNITDASVPSLIKLKKLQGLGVRHTKITQAGIERIRAALPNCSIDG